MDEGYHERLKFVLQQIGQLNRAAELTGYSAEQVAKWRDGKSRPKLEPMMILCEAAGISLDWLAFGRGPAVALLSNPSKVGDASDDPLRRGEDGNTVYIALSSAVASAGAGLANAEVEEFERLPFSRSLLRQHGVASANARFITARGDSMEPTIPNGGIVLIDISRRELQSAGIYVLTRDEVLLIKRVDPGLMGLRLISDNKAYADEIISRGDASRVNVVGKVFWVGGPL
jgi:phage repressor protein C with HTH and peptisase S24 domain